MLYCGIDFGTSNSTVALADATSARLIALEDGQPTIPSAVFWEADGAGPSFGRAGIANYVRGEDGRLMRGLKSTLGSGLINERTAIGGRSVKLRDVLARFFAHLRDKLNHEAPGLTQVVLGRPVHFVDDDPAADAAAEAALSEIARSLGFTDVAFQFEPIAAALHYEQSVRAEELVLIVDIGGGTSDVSIVRVSPARAQTADRSGDILANDGIRLGGTDFDRLLSMAEVMPHLGHGSTLNAGKTLMPNHYYLDLATWHRINSLYSPRVAADMKALLGESDRPDLLASLARVIEMRHGHALAMEVEAAKIALSDAPTARLMLKPLTGGANPLATRARFEAAVATPLTRLHGLLQGVLSAAGLRADQIGTVFMTGGSSGLPVLRACVQQVLPGRTIVTGDMLGSVGTGLALEARRRFS